MSYELVDIPSDGGGWFSPKDEMKSYVAFLIEVKDFELQRPGNFGPKDSALVDLTSFATMGELDAGTPTEVREGVRIEYTVLSAQLKKLVGKATVQTLIQRPATKPGQKPAWAWSPASAEVKGKVGKYLADREAELQAALANAPGFDD